MTRISDMTPVQITSPTGVYAPVEKTGSATNYRVDLAAMSSVTPQLFGAVADGVTDDSAAFVAALLYLRGFALNATGAGFYKGSPSLFIPAGNYFLNTTAIDVFHTLIIEGEGSGRDGPGAGGCSHLRWAANTNGLRIQGPNTNGNTGVDTNPNTHDGCGLARISGLCLEGAFAGTEGDYHGLVCRGPTIADDLYIKNWQGEGVKLRAGNQVSGGTLGGNVSGSRFTGVKTEGCRIGFDTGGADANVILFINCNGYQNRQAGFLDDNGAGSNTYITCHTASNGVVTGTWPQTQCSNSGEHYALKWGGNPTIAPSGDTTDTANWLHIETGAAVTNLIPAWVNTPNTFRDGGDYVTINSAGVHLVNCYSENGGFSQFTTGTLIENGTIALQYFRGGTRIVPGPGGLDMFMPTSGSLNLKTRSGEMAILALDETSTAFGYIDFLKSGGATINGNNGVHLKKAGTTVATIDDLGISGVAAVTATGTGGVGYATGAGAAVTQLTDKSTATPAINKACGKVTMNGAALAGGAKVSFVVTNSLVAATDTIIVSVASGGTANAYRAAVTAISAGAGFTVTVENITGGSLSEAPVLNFAIIKAVAA